MENINNSNSHSPSSPSKEIIEIKDYHLQLPEWGLECLQNAAIQQRVPRPRSLAWAIMLNAVPQPNQDIVSSVRTHRNFYNDLKSKLSMDPRAVIGDDPLSQNDESVWKQHFCDNELKALILQDVVRTFPDELYFREKEVQDIMVEVLFFWARSHSHVGYRQGMHEILAPLLLELYLDRKFAPNNLSDTLKYVLQEEYLEHDSYMLFNAIMKGLEKFYTTGDIVPTSEGRMPTSNVVHNPNEVVRYLEKIRDEYLVPLDPELAAHLTECNISLELFGIRWLRLLFGREFPRSELPHLWGFLFADGPTLPHIHFVVIAMLISNRNTLVHPEPGVVLSALMRPSPAPAPHVCALALHLRRPLAWPRPPPPAPAHAHAERWPDPPEEDSGSEGVAEGADVARELAALALVRSQLPRAAAALALALPRPPPHVAQPLQQILQLAALIQCRNHALVDVETALEAAEGQSATTTTTRKQIVPVAIPLRRGTTQKPTAPKLKEVQLKVFNQSECTPSDLPFMDPLRSRTE
ncbi:TBC1 domain family member 5 [Amyelois transitella]|uniref:TBC1 domain family member 5 n=1 Tax=Amyelois transitella TaxID=680683 RepID=UPI00298F82E0|nr:TBC1 domain family member 5 [Amyelois transitella]